MQGSLFKEAYFYPMAIMLFMFDVFCFSFIEKQLLYTVLCFFCLQLYEEISITQLSLVSFLIALESLLYFGKFGIQLCYIFPIIFISSQAKTKLYARSFQPYVVLIVCLLLQCLFLEPYMLQIRSSILYTFSRIIANIILLFFLSLIDTSQGNLSNRFDPFSWFKEESPDS